MTRVRDVIRQARDTVDSNLSDPNRYRDEKWVFDHFPNHSKGNTKPRIGFYTGAEGRPQKGLGDVTTFSMGDMNAGIFVKNGDSYDFDNDGSNEPAEDLLDYLKEKVITIIEDNQSDFTGLGDDVNYVKPVDANDPVRPENKNWSFQQVVFEVRID